MSNPRKSFDHPGHLKSGVPPPPPPGGGVLGRFGLKTGIDFAYRVSFERTMGVYERIHHFSSK